MNLPWLIVSTLSGLLGIVSTLAFAYRRRWAALLRVRKVELCSSSADQRLADWTRNTKISVITVTGTLFSTTLGELASSENPYRAWNVPVSVGFHPGNIDEVGQDQAKEHRG